MDSYLIRDDMAFVSADGDYGQGVIVFNPDLLNDEQWEKLTDMHDNDRAAYVEAILLGNDEEVARIEHDNFGEVEA